MSISDILHGKGHVVVKVAPTDTVLSAVTKLAESAGIDLWRQWSYVYDGPAGLHSAQVRATDRDGETQSERRTKVFPSGATGWHQIQFTTE